MSFESTARKTSIDMSKVMAKQNEETRNENRDKKKIEAEKIERRKKTYSYLKEHFIITKFIMESGCKLKLPTVSISTACVLYHRFWTETVNKQDFEPYIIGTAVLYLASKVEETICKLRDVINVCYRTTHKEARSLEVGSRYWDLRDSVVNCELFILRVFGFKVAIDNPHKYMLHYLKSLQDWVEPDTWQLSQVTQLSWSVLRDSYHIPVVLDHPPSHIAIAVVYFAVLCTGMHVPSQEARKTWWKAMCKTVTEEELQIISEKIMDLYDYESKPL